MKRKQRRELREAIESILQRNTSMEYERVVLAISHLQFIRKNAREGTKEEQAIGVKKFEEKIEQAAQILKELPPEILEGEEDLKRVYMGYMREETREKLKEFYKTIKKRRWIF